MEKFWTTNLDGGQLSFFEPDLYQQELKQKAVGSKKPAGSLVKAETQEPPEPVEPLPDQMTIFDTDMNVLIEYETEQQVEEEVYVELTPLPNLPGRKRLEIREAKKKASELRNKINMLLDFNCLTCEHKKEWKGRAKVPDGCKECTIHRQIRNFTDQMAELTFQAKAIRNPHVVN